MSNPIWDGPEGDIGDQFMRMAMDRDAKALKITRGDLAIAYDRTFKGRSRGAGHPASSFHTLWKHVEAIAAQASKEPGG